jgi:hypothetical protein
MTRLVTRRSNRVIEMSPKQSPSRNRQAGGSDRQLRRRLARLDAAKPTADCGLFNHASSSRANVVIAPR